MGAIDGLNKPIRRGKWNLHGGGHFGAYPAGGL